MLTKLRYYYELAKAKIVGALKSWTIWFNTVVAALPSVLEYAQEQFPALREFLPESIYGWAITVIIFGNILLRFKTTKPLEEK